LNGSTKQVALAFASFAAGAAIVAILGNSKARAKLVEGGKRLVQRN